MFFSSKFRFRMSRREHRKLGDSTLYSLSSSLSSYYCVMETMHQLCQNFVCLLSSAPSLTLYNNLLLLLPLLLVQLLLLLVLLLLILLLLLPPQPRYTPPSKVNISSSAYSDCHYHHYYHKSPICPKLISELDKVEFKFSVGYRAKQFPRVDKTDRNNSVNFMYSVRISIAVLCRVVFTLRLTIV